MVPTENGSFVEMGHGASQVLPANTAHDLQPEACEGAPAGTNTFFLNERLMSKHFTSRIVYVTFILSQNLHSVQQSKNISQTISPYSINIS